MRHLHGISYRRGLRLLLVGVALAYATGTHAAPFPCLNALADRSEDELRAELTVLGGLQKTIFTAYEAARTANPVIEAVLPRNQMYELMLHPEGDFMARAAKAVIDKALKDTTEVPVEEGAAVVQMLRDGSRQFSPQETALLGKMRRALREYLTNKVPQSQLEERVNGLGSSDPAVMQRTLGYLTAPDAALLLHGGNHLQPTPESLIGQYLAETGATTVQRTFGTQPVDGNGARALDPNSPQGPERLVIRINDQTLPIYTKLFTIPNLMIHLHGARQGTLYVGFNGQSGSYARMQGPIRGSEGAIWPHIILSTSEAGRAQTYFDIGASHNNIVKTPGATLEGFCSKGGYTSCTHWWGEMPISDRRVDAWVFPGKIDQYASGPDISTDANANKAPRRQPLASYTIPSGVPADVALRVRRLMTFPQGPGQLAPMLGSEAQLTYGEWANPGYVAISILGRAPVDRVPFLFYYGGNHRDPLPANFDPLIAAY